MVNVTIIERYDTELAKNVGEKRKTEKAVDKMVILILCTIIDETSVLKEEMKKKVSFADDVNKFCMQTYRLLLKRMVQCAQLM